MRYGKLPRGGVAKLDLSQNGVSWQSDYVDRCAEWDTVVEIVLDQQFILIKLDSVTFNWVPRRLFAQHVNATNFIANCHQLQEQQRGIQLPLDHDLEALRKGMRDLDAEIGQLRNFVNSAS